MKHAPPVVLALLGLFIIAQVIGMFVVSNYVDPVATKETGEIVYNDLPGGFERPDVEAIGGPDYTFIFIGIAVIVGTGLLLLIIKFGQLGLWKIWYSLSVVISLWIAWAAFIPSIVAGILAIIAAGIKVFRPNFYVHNLTELFIYSGLAAIFVPILNIFSASILLILISLYDMYAVWKSKHMVALAKFQTSSNLFAGLSVPKDLKAPVSAVEMEEPKKSKKIPEDAEPVAIIGGGDIGFPLLFAGAVMAVHGMSLSFIIPLFATIGLATLFVISKKGKFYPAMPFISAGCFVGLGIVYLITYM